VHRLKQQTCIDLSRVLIRELAQDCCGYDEALVNNDYEEGMFEQQERDREDEQKVLDDTDDDVDNHDF
jgi:hypothetical protein